MWHQHFRKVLGISFQVNFLRDLEHLYYTHKEGHELDSLNSPGTEVSLASSSLWFGSLALLA